MKTLKFKHEDKNYTVKGEWDKDTFTAQTFQGKKEASGVFSVAKEKVKDGVLADDAALETVVMEAAKNDVINGES
ncbi:MAG: hypothetical protein V3U57_04500 [Robiginitomaculum sp.]